ncbi:MAG: hypothetical protein NVS1B4_17400 [Gemmatimonadaceae bacterium]
MVPTGGTGRTVVGRETAIVRGGADGGRGVATDGSGGSGATGTAASSWGAAGGVGAGPATGVGGVGGDARRRARSAVPRLATYARGNDTTPSVAGGGTARTTKRIRVAVVSGSGAPGSSAPAVDD